MKLPASIIQVFDPPMCCPTGLCGPDVDPKLVQFATDLDWLKNQGIIIQRHNLSQNPSAFVEHQLVNSTLADRGEAALPLVLINGQVAVAGRYPGRNELAGLVNLKVSTSETSAKSNCGCGGNC